MTLSEFVASKKRSIFQDILDGREPNEGSYDPGALSEARLKGSPQIGAARFTPDSIILEYIFSGAGGASEVVSITLEAPERIVFLPVPSWVVESIWQGDIDGSYHFEKDARLQVEAFMRQLEPDANAPLFGPKAATRRE